LRLQGISREADRESLHSTPSIITRPYASKFTEDWDAVFETTTSDLLRIIEAADEKMRERILEKHLESVGVKESQNALSNTHAKIKKSRKKEKAVVRQARGSLWKRMWARYDAQVEISLSNMEEKIRKRCIVQAK
jgi:hypothetical protein